MPEPIKHHLATGIHPGAFVQSTVPDTADVQDGVLWLDTSAGPPYQLKRWDAGAALWHPVQMDATGYPLPGGHRLEVAAVAYQATVLADLPVAYWTLEESGTSIGSVYADATGHGYDVQVLLGAITHGPGPLAGTTAPIMPARNWAGAPDSITTDALIGASTAGLPHDGDPYTLELWVRPGASTIFMAPLAYGPLGGAGPFLGLDLRNRTPSTPSQELEAYNPSNSFSQRFDTPFLFDGAWHHVVLTDDAAGHVRLYVDAELVGSTDTADPSNGYLPATGDVISLGDAGSNGGSFPCPAQEDYSGGLAQVAIYPFVLTASQVSAHYAALTGMGVRLVDATGNVYWQHDGTTERTFSAGDEVLRTPIPVMALPATQLLGKDAATGLPMWSAIAPPAPPPPPVHETYSQPDETITGTDDYPDPPPSPPPDAQRVCGAAEGMATALVQIYNAVIWIINKEKGNLLGAFTSNLKRELSAQLVSLLTEAELGQFEIDAAQLAADVLLALAEALISSTLSLPRIQGAEQLPPTGDSIYQVIRNCAWQALWLTSGDYFAQADSSNGRGTRDNWQMYMDEDWSFFAGSTIPGVGPDNLPWQLRALDSIIKFTPDGTWKAKAWEGANRPSTQCSGATGYPP